MASDGASHLGCSTPSNATESRKSDLRGWVTLNVGGTCFLTTKSTLCKEPASFLCRLVQDDPELPSAKDANGAYLIDRDPSYFPPVLNYLRHGKLIINKHVAEEGVFEEAEFYNIPSLAEMVKQRIEKREQDRFRGNVKHVYRVLQCQEGELTQMLSTFTDGWKIEQIVSVGSQYNYGGTDQAEFLVVVSRDVSNVQTNASPTEQRDGKARELLDRGSRMW